MRSRSIVAGLLVTLLFTACSEQEIEAALQTQLSSVNGDWTGIANSQNAVTLDFHLQEGTSGQLTGSGTMKEANAAAAVPITVSGTFQKPGLSLTFDGMVYEGHNVQGVAQGSYTSAAGISTTLQLTGTNYSISLPILLQEK